MICLRALVVVFLGLSLPALADAEPEGSRVLLLPTADLVAIDGNVPDGQVSAAWASRFESAISRSKFRQAAWTYRGIGDVRMDVAEAKKQFAGGGLPPRVAKLVEAGNAAKREFDFQKQIEMLAPAAQALTSSLLDIGDVSQLIAVRLDLGVAYLGIDEPVFAETMFRGVLRMRPGMELDLRRFAPDVVTKFNNIKQRILAEPRGQIHADIEPAGALVLVDGVPVGETPDIFDVQQGPHLIQVSALGHDPLKRVVDVQTGSRVEVHATLAQQTAYKIADELMSGLQIMGNRVSATELARQLAEDVGVDGVLVTGLATMPGGEDALGNTILDGFMVVGTLVLEEPHTVVATVDTSSAQADAAAAAILDYLAGRIGQPAEDAKMIQVADPSMPVHGVRVDFEANLLGGLHAASGIDGALGSGPFGPVVTPFYKKWWFWTIVTGVVAGSTATTVWYVKDASYRSAFPKDMSFTVKLNP